MSMTATLVKSGHTKLPEPGLHLEEVARKVLLPTTADPPTARNASICIRLSSDPAALSLSHVHLHMI